ncbi:hypothetical protein WMF31_39835 [Sorangium sp. So ce1036]|uniref:hypothetical protein n=1 Tax=Sorangium sp. So ce1036 TaxID=3133328 RepID=UPI003F11F8B4
MSPSSPAAAGDRELAIDVGTLLKGAEEERMKRSKVVGLAMLALAAVSCSDPPDVAELLTRAGHSWVDYNVAADLRERDLGCTDRDWLPEVIWPPTMRPGRELAWPPIDRILLVAWDMPGGALRGWDLEQGNVHDYYWSVLVPVEEVGFGCEERYTTGFFLLASWPDNNISPAVGFQRAARDAFREQIWAEEGGLVVHSTSIHVDKANVPAPDKATYYLKNLFTGATFSTDVPTDGVDGFPMYSTRIEVDYEELGLGAMTDVVTCVVYKRSGVELTNHCLTVTDSLGP